MTQFRSIKKWRIFCEDENQYVEFWSEDTPTYCIHDSTHTIDALETTQLDEIISNNETYPKGSGVRFRSPCITDMTSAYTFAPFQNKNLVMLESKVTFNINVENITPIVFEVHRILNLGLPGDPQHYIVSQDYYGGIEHLFADADEMWGCGTQGVYRLDFIWPQADSHNRVPTILYSALGDFVKIYLTNDEIHEGVGMNPTNLYWEPISGVRLFHTYDNATSFPSWPDSAPKVRAAHVCFHCISFDEDVEL